ncbi:MAG: hypothetical protein AAB701_03145 [Patescibacteria group bacterium]
MYITPHVLTGTALGVAVGNPVAGFFLGVASHFVLDAIPHTDSGTWHFYEPFSSHSVDARDLTLGVIDIALAFFGFLALISYAPLVAAGPIAGAIGGALPDAFVLLGLFVPGSSKWKGFKWYFDLVEKYHYTARPHQFVLGVVTQLVTIGGVVWYLLGS